MASASMVHLDQWSNTQAPLSEAEKASVNLLSEWLASDLPSTSKLEETSSSTSAGLPSRPTTASSTRVAGPSLPNAPLTDAPSYLAWFAKQQAHITSSTQSSHAIALQSLAKATNEADELLDHLEAARIHISELRAGARFVEEGSEGLREEAEIMVERIDHLSQLAQSLSLRLSYFAILPSSTSFLSSPSLSLVTSNEFLFTLDRLDVALAFVDAHPHYRDSPLYKMRFEHCVLRAGTLIRMYTLSRWKELTNEVSMKMREWEKARMSKGKEKEFDGDSHVMMNLADPPIYALLWERFEEEAPLMRPLIAELEKRASSLAAPASTDVEAPISESNVVDEKILLSDYSKIDNGKTSNDSNGMGVFRSPEFVTLLSECRVAYFEARRALLSGMISNCLARIEVSAQTEASNSVSTGSSVKDGQTSTEAFIKRSLGLLSAVCEKEVSLCRHLFSLDSQADSTSYKDISAYIQSLCAPLDDRIRPRLQKETNLTSIATICMALIGDRDLESNSSPLLCSTLATSILKEAQDRLLVRAKWTLTAGPTLTQFSPKEEDLDYPSKLKKSQKHRRAQSSIGGAGLLEAALELEEMPQKGFRQVDATTLATATSSVRLFASPPKSIVSSWYPPLSETLRLLSATNDALPTSVFVELAYAVVDACRNSIIKAGEVMASQGGFAGGRIGLSGRMDVPLFLLRHFYLLREIMASVELRKASAGAMQVDRRTVGANISTQAGSATIVDFARLVETLNSLWVGLRGFGGGLNQTIVDEKTAQPSRSSQQEALDSDLSSASNQFVDVVFQGMVLPLRVSMDQRSRPSRSRRSTSNAMSPPITSPAIMSLPNQDYKSPPPFPSPSSQSNLTLNKVRSAVKAFETCAETNLKEANEAMRLYLEDDRAIESLAEPIVSRIMETYSTFVHSIETSGLEVREFAELKSAEEQRERLIEILKA